MLDVLLGASFNGPTVVVDAKRQPDLSAALREIAPKKPSRVVLEGRFQARDVVIGPEFSGAVFEGRNAALSAGTVIRGFRATTFLGKRVWAAPIATAPRRLSWRETSMHRPRLPEKDFFRFEGFVGDEGKAEWNQGQSHMRYHAGDLRAWRNLDDVEVVAHHLWVTSRLPIASLDEANHVVEFGKKSVFKLMDDYTGKGGVYRVENVAEALSSPGQFYVDRPSKTVYVVPLPGVDPRAFAPIAPGGDRVLTVRGAANVTLRGFSVEDAEYAYPATSSGDVQAAVSVPAAVRIVDAPGTVVDSVKVRRVGEYGLSVEGKCSGVVVKNCLITDVGGGGVKIDHGTSGTTVSDCRMDHLGDGFAPAVGIWIGNSSHNRILRNEIAHLYYTGISVGWTWGYAAHDGADNLIEGNRIHDVGQGELSDMGGIYHLGVAPGTIIRGNRIERVSSRGYGGWGIYLDEGSSNILVEDNVVLHTKSGGFHQHYGRDNLIRRNVFAYAETEGVIIRSRAENHVSFTIEDNVIVADKTPIVAGNWSGDGYVFRNNHLWAGGKTYPLPAKASGNDWAAPKVKL